MRHFTWVAAAALTLSGPAHAETRRLAIVVGNNAGSAELPPLRYAESDASKMARALTDVGEVAPDNLLLLQGGSEAQLRAALGLVRARVAELHRAPDARALLVFYFSGHSDGEVLELGADRLGFGELKALLKDTGADVRLSIIDACMSGAAVEAKGGKPAPAFAIRLADDLDTTGEATLTSSAANEVALESRDLRGSYFTSALVSGLRGAADASGDKQITLAEAYRYAYQHTVSATAATLEGAQHPVYDFHLSGEGELVLATLQHPTAAIELPAELDRATVTDVARDQVVAEVAAGAARTVAVEPGTYAIRALRAGKAYGGRFELGPGAIRPVTWSDLSPLAAPRVARKGEPEQGGSWGPASPRVIASLGVARGVADGLGPQGALRISFEPTPSWIVALGAYTGSAPGSAYSESALHLRLGYGAGGEWRRLSASADLEAGPGWIWQRAPGAPSGYTPALSLGPHGVARVRIAGPISAVLEAESPVALVKLDQRVTMVWLPAALVGLAWVF